MNMLVIYSLLLIQLAVGTGFEIRDNLSRERFMSTPFESVTPADTSSSFVSFISSVIDSKISESEQYENNIIWCGDQEKIFFVATSKGTVYRSSDKGVTWNNMLEKFERAKNGGSIFNSVILIAIWSPIMYLFLQAKEMLQSPLDKQVIIFLDSFVNNAWVTEDCGKNVRQIRDGWEDLSYFKFHLTRRNWLLGLKGRAGNNRLYVSKDLGRTWTFIAEHVRGWSWAEQEGGNIPPDRIFLSRDHHWDLDRWQDWQTRTHILYTDENIFFKRTSNVVLDRGYNFLITQDQLFALRVDDEDASKATLYFGNIEAEPYELKPVVLPESKTPSNKKDNPLEYLETLLKTSRGQFFFHVNQDHNGHSQYGNTYVPDSTGRNFSLWIRNNVRNYQHCDFEKIAGLDGIFLANIYDPQVVENRGRLDHYVKLEQYEMTIMTFNNGETWQSLQPPKLNSKGEEIVCEKENGCALHLHSYTYYTFVPFYTSENSLGLILGVGNVGKYLDFDTNKLNTYLSRDGGLSWHEVLQGMYIYGIGDSGAIILAAPYRKATNELYYSLNEGLTWESIQISNSSIFINRIAVDSGNATTRIFIVSGTISEDYSPAVVISVDFDTLNLRTCQKPERPDDPDSDYEKWILNSNCKMGHVTTYIRRKRETRCFNPELFDQLHFSHCECTEQDWECDVGYQRTREGLCQKITGEVSDPDIECGGFFSIGTRGYRKIKGNTCMGGVNPILLPCPETESLSFNDVVWFLAFWIMIKLLLRL